MGFDISEELGSNETAEIEGVWVSLGDDGRVRVAFLGNKHARKAYNKIPAVIRREIDDSAMTNTQGINFLSAFISEQILKNWEGLANKGKTITYSTENAKEMLKTHRRFRERIWDISQDEKLFNIELEEDAKNLLKPSSGS